MGFDLTNKEDLELRSLPSFLVEHQISDGESVKWSTKFIKSPQIYKESVLSMFVFRFILCESFF